MVHGRDILKRYWNSGSATKDAQRSKEYFFAEVRTLRKRASRSERLLVANSSLRDLPFAPYRSRQTVAELLKTCDVIRNIPEQREMRFSLRGLGNFNAEGNSSIIAKLLKGLNEKDFNDDHAFLHKE